LRRDIVRSNALNIKIYSVSVVMYFTEQRFKVFRSFPAVRWSRHG